VRLASRGTRSSNPASSTGESLANLAAWELGGALVFDGAGRLCALVISSASGSCADGGPRVVSDLDQKALAAHHAKAEVFDRRINHGVVRDRYQRVIRCTILVLRKPTPSTVPSPPDTLTVMPEAEHHDQHRAEEVGETVPSRKRHG
jgi:hypothetical protein